MFNRPNLKKGTKHDGEQPFWISFADLMTACMTLFLVVMAVTIIELHKKYEGQEAQEKARKDSILACSIELMNDPEVKKHNAQIYFNNGDDIRIDLGSVVNFDSGQFLINSDGSRFLRSYIPSVLKTIKSKQCEQFFKEVVVEGYTDIHGTYMTNLQLSLQRSRQVVCELSKSDGIGKTLTSDELKEIRDLFLVGGFSFNSLKKTNAESRRVELKLEFRQLNEKKSDNASSVNDLSNKEFGRC